MSRTENVKRNLVFNILKYVTQLVLQFVLRTLLIYVMGAEYIGLNGLFTNIFSFLNLAELGIGTAIVFSMYKPIAENNTEKIKTLQNLYKKFYFYIIIVVLALGLVVTPFLNYLIKEEITVNINIYVLYLMYLLNTIAGYFSAHKRSLLFAYQRNDMENKVRTLCIFGMSIIQIVVIVVFKNYYLYFVVNILFTILESVLIHLSANKLFPEIKGKSEPLDIETKKEITKNVTALSLHKVGTAIVFSTDNILISSFLGVVVLAAYSNYALITNALLSVFLLLNNAILGSVGNLVASKERDFVYSKFKLINFIFAYFSNFTTICLIVLFQPFMQVWTGGGVYMLEFTTVILICFSFYLNRMRSGVSIFRDASGLYWQDRWKPIVEAIVNLVVSIVLAKFMGINGIFIGTIVSTIVAPLWVEPYVLYKHYFKKSVWNYFKRYVLDALIMIAGAVICYFVCSLIPDGGIWWLIFKFAVCIVLSNIVLILAYLPSKEFRELVSMGKDMVGKLFKRKKNKCKA